MLLEQDTAVEEPPQKLFSIGLQKSSLVNGHMLLALKNSPSSQPLLSLLLEVSYEPSSPKTRNGNLKLFNICILLSRQERFFTCDHMDPTVFVNKNDSTLLSAVNKVLTSVQSSSSRLDPFRFGLPNSYEIIYLNMTVLDNQKVNLSKAT